MKLGAHVSAAGGIDKAIDRAAKMGAETIQIFGSPPQSLRPPSHTQQSTDSFKLKAKEKKISPIFLHAPYLINLATPKQSHLEISINSLMAALNLAKDLDAEGVIFHTGSSLGADFESVQGQVVQAIKKILSATSGAKLIIENSAGAGGTVGDNPAEIGAIIKAVGSARVATCLDTQHAFASGYDLSGEPGIRKMISDWETHIGLDKVIVIHANDSKVPLGSNRDRHENIGQGLIGKAGFSLMKKNGSLGELPWIIEVPGFADQGPDKENLDILKSL